MNRENHEPASVRAFTLDRFGRQPWRKHPPATAARLLLEALEPALARRMSRRALADARRARSRRHFAYWTEVGDELARDDALRLDTAVASYYGSELFVRP
jgi:hypothetical protein